MGALSRRRPGNPTPGDRTTNSSSSPTLAIVKAEAEADWNELWRWRNAVRASNLTMGARATAWTLSFRMGKTGSAYPSVDTLSKETGAGRSSVKRYLAELKDARFLEVEERRTGDGHQLSSVYRAQFPDSVQRSNLDPGREQGECGEQRSILDPRRGPKSTRTEVQNRRVQRSNLDPELPLSTKTLEPKNLSFSSLSAIPSKAEAPDPASRSSPRIAAPTKSRREGENQGSSFPADFRLGPKDYDFAKTRGFDREETIDRTHKLKDHALAQSWLRGDWHAQWREWIRRAVTLDPPDPKPWSDYDQP